MHRVAAALIALLASASACRRAPEPPQHAAPPIEAPPARPAPPTPTSTASLTDGAIALGTSARCPVRAFPPEDLAVDAPLDGPASVAWSGQEWGVAWTETPAGESTAFFARVGPDGRRRGSPTRLSDRGYRATAPSVAWTGESWSVAFSGGASRFEEIWLVRVDARGTRMGRPQRLTSRDRRDYTPSLAFSGQQLVAAWSGMSGGRHGVFALRMNRWGSQIAPPARVADRAERLSSPQLIWASNEWAIAWLVSRTEALAVDMARLDAMGNARGFPAHVTLGQLGGNDLHARFGAAWNGARYGVLWDEVRDGSPHVFFVAVGRRLDDESPAVMLSSTADAAHSPAVTHGSGSDFYAAWIVERGSDRHVQLATVNAEGHVRGEPIELQSHDGRSDNPALSATPDALGVAATTPRGVSFHRVQLGPCPR